MQFETRKAPQDTSILWQDGSGWDRTGGISAPDRHCYVQNAELLRENKRMLDKAIRDLDRERVGLQTQEKKLVAEIKKTAKQGQMVRL